MYQLAGAIVLAIVLIWGVASCVLRLFWIESKLEEMEDRLRALELRKLREIREEER